MKADDLNKEIEELNMDHMNKTEAQETTIANLQSILTEKKMLDKRKDLEHREECEKIHNSKMQLDLMFRNKIKEYEQSLKDLEAKNYDLNVKN